MHYQLTIIVGAIAKLVARVDFYLANKFYTLRNKALDAIEDAVNTVVAEADNAIIFADERMFLEYEKIRQAYSRGLDSVTTSHKQTVDTALATRTAKLNQLKQLEIKLGKR